MRDCSTFATLNLMLGTLRKIAEVRTALNHIFPVSVCIAQKPKYLSFAALTTTGSSFEHVISELITGARSEIARKMVIRYR